MESFHSHKNQECLTKQESKMWSKEEGFLLLFFPLPVPSYLAPAVGVAIYSQGCSSY